MKLINIDSEGRSISVCYLVQWFFNVNRITAQLSCRLLESLVIQSAIKSAIIKHGLFHNTLQTSRIWAHKRFYEPSSNLISTTLLWFSASKILFPTLLIQIQFFLHTKIELLKSVTTPLFSVLFQTSRRVKNSRYVHRLFATAKI